jgi:thiol-disulfide isomerase/thioredoxin
MKKCIIKNLSIFILAIFLLSSFSSIVIAEDIVDNTTNNIINHTMDNRLNNTIENDGKVHIYFFWAEGCPHCHKEQIYLDELVSENNNYIVHSLETTKYPENRELLQKVGEKLGVTIGGVPFTVIGENYVVGFHSKETTGPLIEENIQCNIETQCKDVVADLVTPYTPKGSKGTLPSTISLPLFGEINTKDISLPVLTIMIAAIDGFNPCAMWVLLFLISLLLGMKDKKRMWIFGSIFILASAFVYFLFMTAWLNIFLFLGVIFWVRIGIGLLALYAGYHNLKEYLTNKTGVCKITGDGKRQAIFEKLKKTVQEKHFLIALSGIIILAFAVNLVELICSAGLPAVYTNILTLSNLSGLQYYAYLALYIFIFMLDDLFVFFIAMKTMQMGGISAKYTKYSHLIGGAIMLLIGVLMIFAPEMLMFG